MELSMIGIPLGFILITRYQSRIHRPCDIVAPGDRMISYRNAHLTCALLVGTDRMHIPAIIISGMVIWKARIYCLSATGCLPIPYCLICTLPTQHSSRRWRQRRGQGGAS